MALPTTTDVKTMSYTLQGQPAVYLEAKSLTSSTMDYTLQAQPAVGLPPATTSTNFLIMFN